MGRHLTDGEDKKAQDEDPGAAAEGKKEKTQRTDQHAGAHRRNGLPVLDQAADSDLQQDDRSGRNGCCQFFSKGKAGDELPHELIDRCGIDKIAQIPEDRAEILEIEDPKDGVDKDHQHEAGIAKDDQGVFKSGFQRGALAGQLRVLEEKERRYQHHGCIERRGHENLVPGKGLGAAENIHHDRRQKSPQIDHPVVDAEAETRIGLAGAVSNGPRDNGLEKTGPEGHEQ